MAISLDHKIGTVYLFILDTYDSDGHLSGYSVRMAEYGDSLIKWADDAGVIVTMKLGEKWCEVSITLVSTNKESKTLIQREDDTI